MKILFLQPNYDSHVIHPPLGLGYLASFLKRKGYQAILFDGTLYNASIEDFVKSVREFQPDLVGLSVLSRGHFQARQIIKALKQHFKKLPIIIGGTQVTAAPRKVLLDLGADFAIIGEGEITIAELAAMLEKGQKNFNQIKGLAYQTSKNRVKINPLRELITDLNTLPFPAWHLMPPVKYRIAPILEPARGTPIAPIITSRGCPYNCSFCASNVTWRRRIRFRSPQNVLAEIKMLKNDFAVKEIHFSDDNFTMDIKRAAKICDLLIKEKINLPWQCPNGVRIDCLTLPLLKKMKKAGCYALGLGIESGNQKILKRVNKQLDLKIVPRVLKNMKKAGIESYGFFILGLPGDTRKTIQETIDFALHQSFDRAWFNIFTPYLGSPAFAQWLGKRKLRGINWDIHDCSTAVVETSDLNRSEIEGLQKQALFRFYLRPKTFFSVASRIRAKEVVTFLMSRFWRNAKN